MNLGFQSLSCTMRYIGVSVFTLSVFGARIKGFASAWAATAGAAVQNRLSIKIGVKECTTL